MLLIHATYPIQICTVVAYIANWASVCINPIIYVVGQKKYQEAIRHLVDRLRQMKPGKAQQEVGVQCIQPWPEDSAEENIKVFCINA